MDDTMRAWSFLEHLSELAHLHMTYGMLFPLSLEKNRNYGSCCIKLAKIG